MDKREEIYLVESYTVPNSGEGIRLSDIKAGTFNSILSRKGFKLAIKRGHIKLNGDIGHTSNYIKEGDIIDIYKVKSNLERPSIEIDIEVIYEDDHLAVVNKPAGIVVSGNRRWTLENALPNNLTKSNLKDGLDRPEPIHRLDYPTSGALLIGKTTSAVIALNKMFETRDIEKRYIAITVGDIADSGVITSEIEGRESKTEFNILSRVSSPKYSQLNLTSLHPYSGRKHQLRIHMERQGTPILGDIEHGVEGLILKGKGLYLHAYSLLLRHPFRDERLSIEAPIPNKFIKIFPEETSLKQR